LRCWQSPCPLLHLGKRREKLAPSQVATVRFASFIPPTFRFARRGTCDLVTIRTSQSAIKTRWFVFFSQPRRSRVRTWAAGFQVREIQRRNSPPTTADECVTPYPNVQGSYVPSWPEFLVSAEHPVEMIDGMSFLHGIRGGAAMGHGSSVDLYRAFHNGVCFELSTTSTATNPNNYDPPRETLSAAEEKKLSETMSDILHSFRFTK